MKQFSCSLFLVLCLISLNCGKDKGLSDEEKAQIEVSKATLYGKWKFESVYKGGALITTANTCYADNTIEFRTDGKATISQGTCIDSPGLPATEDFAWNFTSTTNINLGGDDVKISTLTDSSLQFVRVIKSGGTLEEYKWKK